MTPEQWEALVADASRRTEESLRARRAKLGERTLKVHEIEDLLLVASLVAGGTGALWTGRFPHGLPLRLLAHQFLRHFPEGLVAGRAKLVRRHLGMPPPHGLESGHLVIVEAAGCATVRLAGRR